MCVFMFNYYSVNFNMLMVIGYIQHWETFQGLL